MKKLLFCLVLLSSAVCCFAAPLAIGSKVDDIKLDVWYQNKKAPVEQFLGKKIIAILFITTAHPDPMMLKRVEANIEALKKQNVEVFFVANGLPKNHQNVPAWKNVKTPIAFDIKSELFNTLGGTTERIPFWVVITPERELAWRGKINLLPALIREMKSGKYKIADAVRREKFTAKIGTLLRAKKYTEAIEMISEEQKIEPGNLELVGLKVNLLTRLKKMDTALQEIDKVIAVKPENFAIYEFKLRFMRQAMPKQPLRPLFDEMAVRFAKNPSFLLSMVQKELNLPIDQMNAEGALTLAKAAADSKAFRNKQEEGVIRLGYARTLHFCGRPDLAAIEAGKAEKLLSGKSKKTAAVIREHYSKISKIAQSIK